MGLACGDALGATLEFLSPQQIRQRYGVHREICGGGWLNLQAGQVTDDTQMCLAIGQAIIARQGWDIKAIADHFLAWMQTDPPDIGNTVRRGINRYRDTGELFSLPLPDAAGNGACMRNLPVAIFSLFQPDRLAEYSLQQSHITHNHPLSDAAVLSFGRITQALILGRDMMVVNAEISALISAHPQFEFKPYPGKASAYIVETVQTVLHCFLNTSSFEDCLIATVNQGGDADTTGALAGMLAGAHYGLAAIPERWLQALDQQVVREITAQTRELLVLGQSS